MRSSIDNENGQAYLESWTDKLSIIMNDVSNFASMNVAKVSKRLKQLAERGIISPLTFDQLVKILPSLVSVSKSYLDAIKELSKSESLAQKETLSTLESSMSGLSGELTVIFENMDSDEARLEALRIIMDDRDKTRRSNERIYRYGSRLRNGLAGAAVGAFVVVSALVVNSRKA